MPSIFHRHRASDVTPDTLKSESTSTPARQKRLSVDISSSRNDSTPLTPPSSGGKIKALFGGGSVDREARRESLKKRLSSASTFFKSQADLTSTSPTIPTANDNGDDSNGVMARYNDPAPRANGRISGEFASPTLFPENFSLSSTQSPESPTPVNGRGRRGSVTWQPSYPLVVPDDEYAVIPPDGQAAPNGVITPLSPASADENSRRRSLDLSSSAMPASLPPPILPATKPPTPPASAPPPFAPSAVSEANTSTPVSAGEDTVPKGRDRKPSLSLNLSDPALMALPIGSLPSTGMEAQSAVPNPRRVPSMVPLNDTTGPNYSASVPSTPLASTRSRPAPPMRKSTLIQSPPMPQPIKNLPTMQGLPGFAQAGGSGTPGWGALAREGGPKTPKTPGFGGLSTPGGSGGFPWSTPLATPSGKGKERKSYMTEEEIRKARRSMPVMLREPSFKPKHEEEHEEEQGGDAGDDDDEDSETEMEGGGASDDDSEAETEVDKNKAAPSMAAKVLTRGLMGKSKSKQKGKGKASNQVSPMAKSAVQEEEDGAPSASTGPVPLADRRHVNFPRLSQLPMASPSVIVAKPKSVWALQTPSQQPQNTWTQFGSPTPKETPITGSFVQRIPSPISDAASGPSTANLSRNQSYNSGAPGSANSSGYFDSHPSSSQASLSQGSTGAASTPAAGEPTLPKGSGRKELISSGLTGAAINAPVVLGQSEVASRDEADGDDESDDSSDERTNEGSVEQSSEGHGLSSLEQSSTSTMAQVSVPSGPPARPAIYTQVSRSMINLPTPTTTTADAADRMPWADGKATAKPGLSTIRSREEVPTHIDLPPREPSSSTTPPKGILSPIAEWVKPPPTPAAGLNTTFWGKDKDKSDTNKPQALKRRRSADDMMAQPPKYEPPLPGTYIPRPRDEEGKEKLPRYWCAVHIEGMVQRKMEFSSPGVQSRDRSWKKVYLILHGTSLRVFKFDPHRFPLKLDAPIPTIAEEDSEEFLHVHTPADRLASITGPQPNIMGNTARRGSGTESTRRGSVGAADAGTGRRGSVPDTVSAGARRSSVSSTTGSSDNPNSSRTSFSPSIGSSSTGASNGTPDVKDPALFPAPQREVGVRRASVSSTATASTSHGTSLASHFQHNALLKHYSLQKAESGLAADYMKRKNVVRLRMEGEQFLIQTESARDTVDWIEAFQAATNCALDLDERPMPKIITLPRRRRRRPGQAGAGANATTNGNGNNATTSGTATPTSGAAGPGSTSAAAGTGPPSSAVTEMERLLAEDQERPLG